MNIFLAIMATIIFILLYSEKNDIKRKHLTVCFAVSVSVSIILSILKIITAIL